MFNLMLPSLTAHSFLSAALQNKKKMDFEMEFPPRAHLCLCACPHNSNTYKLCIVIVGLIVKSEVKELGIFPKEEWNVKEGESQIFNYIHHLNMSSETWYYVQQGIRKGKRQTERHWMELKQDFLYCALAYLLMWVAISLLLN